MTARYIVKRGALYLTRDGAWSTKQRDAQRYDDWGDVALPDGRMATALRAGLALTRAEWMAAKYVGAKAVRLRSKGQGDV